MPIQMISLNSLFLVIVCPTPPCADDPCLNGGECRQSAACQYTCSCLPGFSGPNCVDGKFILWLDQGPVAQNLPLMVTLPSMATTMVTWLNSQSKSRFPWKLPLMTKLPSVVSFVYTTGPCVAEFQRHRACVPMKYNDGK